METTIPFYAYKETRLDLDSAIQGSTIAIRLPSHGASIHASRTAPKRSHVAEISVAEDENAFRHKYLATAASIYHRTYHNSPRSFLWRIVEDGKVLSIRAVDISRERDAADSNLTLMLTFPTAIKSGCIAFSDSPEHDMLSVFVLLESKDLYTLNLRPDYFRRHSSTEENVVDWCKSYSSSAFGFKKPHRLVSLTADVLLASLQDGSLLKMERISGGDGSIWKETHYNEGGWGQAVRSLVPFHGSNTIRYGDYNIELSAATSIAYPSIRIAGMPYVFTVSLDHRLRVWNLQTGRVAYIGDILNQELELHKEAKKVIDPSQSRLVKVFDDSDESALCVTYSPLGAGEFKFWNITPAEDGNIDVEDLFPDNKLTPQAPTSEIWTLADYSVVQDKRNMSTFTLWALWKINVTYRLHRLDFQSGSIALVRDAWEGNWMAIATETLRETPIPVVLSSDPSDGADKWMDFILLRGRFNKATIETGLAIYARGLGEPKDATRRSGSLPERMCSTIASTASLGRASDGTMDFEQFRTSTEAQWRRFYRLLLELDKQRGEAMSLVIDPEGEMPWIVLADGVTAIRACSGLERIWHNNSAVPKEVEFIARPLFAAAAFRDSFSDQLLHRCRTTLVEELFQDASLTDPARMRTFYDKCDFANQIGDEEFTQLQASLGGSFKNLTLQVYEAVLELMIASENFGKRPEDRPLAEFGRLLIVRGVQETVELHRNVCLDQLILLVLLEVEVNHGDDGIHFETAAVFSQLIAMLKRLELLNWLASTHISLLLEKNERSNSIADRSLNLAKRPPPSSETITVLEGMLRHLLTLDLRRDETMSSAVTEVVIQICAPKSEYELIPAVTQCFLLTNGRADLAMDFSRFTDDDGFSTYIQGRAFLASNDALEAAMLFKKAAFLMAYPNPKKHTENRSAGYLDETEKNMLNAGLPEYYSHIVALFDKERNYSFVIDFARLSLQFIKPKDQPTQTNELRTEMHSRLFNAAIQTTRYELAYSIVALFTDSALQHSSLRTLITRMCESSFAAELVSLPFNGLQDEVDEILAQKCQSIVDVDVGVPYHKILYAWRIRRNDFRGAAAISLDRLQRLQQAGEGDKILGEDSSETPVTKQYITLINALSCVDPKQAWIVYEEPAGKTNGAGGGKEQAKRKVVTLEDVRRSYQEELDRIAAIQNNQFAFAGGDNMDVL